MQPSSVSAAEVVGTSASHVRIERRDFERSVPREVFDRANRLNFDRIDPFGVEAR